MKIAINVGEVLFCKQKWVKLLPFSLCFSLFVSSSVCMASQVEADVILYSGNVVTVDKSFSQAEAVAIGDGRFLHVGSNEEVLAYRGENTKLINLQGKTVIPGLIDSHLHHFFSALNLPNVSLTNARSISDLLGEIAKRVTNTTPGDWVIAAPGWHESLLKEERLPTRWELDTVSPENPVFIPRGGHVSVVNSKALEMVGINRNTDQPAGGVIVRNNKGEPTGVLLETANNIVKPHVRQNLSREKQFRLLQEMMSEYNKYGIVGLTEPGLGDEEISILQAMHEQDLLSVRTHVLIRALGRDSVTRALQKYDQGDGDSMLRIDGFKYLLDGGIEGARFYSPYEIVEGEQPDPHYRGVLNLPEGFDAWVDDLKMIAKAGWQVQTHGAGDETIDVIARAYEQVNDMEAAELAKLRWAVMHIMVPTQSALQKLNALNVTATVQSQSVLLGHNEVRYWGRERASYAVPIRDIIDYGIVVGGGSDAPIVPVNPFLSMWWMTTRGTLKGYPLGVDQAITVEEALKLYTINNAYIQGVEDTQGSIEKGKLADLVVLNAPILSVPKEEIRNMSAMMTMVGGRIVYTSPDYN